MSASLFPAETLAVNPEPGVFECRPEGGPAHLSLHLVERLEREALEAFRAITSRGSEIGGVLLGRRSGGTMLIDDFELIGCEYARGPLYMLSEADGAAWTLAIQRRQGSVVGLFRSNTRKDLKADEEDLALAARFLAPGQAMLLVKPFATKPSQAMLCRWNGSAAGLPATFPFRCSELLRAPYAAAIIRPAADTAPVPETAPALAREQPVLRIVSRRDDPHPPRPPAAEVLIDTPPSTAPEVEELPAAQAAEPPEGIAARPEQTAHFSGRKIWIAAGIATVVLAGGLAFLFANRGSQPPPPPSAAQVASAIALRVERNAGQLLLTWNREAEPVKNAKRAVLSIWDGKQHEQIELEANQFRSGSIVYSPMSTDVSFRLEILGPNEADRIREHVRVLAGRPSAMAEPEPEAAADPDAVAEEPAAEEVEEQAPKPAAKPFQSLAARISVPDPATLPEPPSVMARSSAEAPRAIATPALPGAPPAPPEPKPAPATPPPPVKVGGAVSEARLLARREPVYPPLARQARVSGTVRVQARITKDGQVTEVTVISGHPLLRQAALDAVKQWTYSPSMLNGQPVEAHTIVDVTFNMNR
jgi:TonB family protein